MAFLSAVDVEALSEKLMGAWAMSSLLHSEHVATNDLARQTLKKAFAANAAGIE